VTESASNIVRSQCWDEAINTFGTAYVFEERARKLKLRLQLLNFVGLGVPIIVGLTVMTFGTDPKALPFVLTVAGVLGAIQVVVSLWSLIAGWSDAYAYSRTSASENRELSNRFKDLGQNPPTAYDELKTRFDLLQVENRNRSSLDVDQGVTNGERRMGMRAGLRQFKRRCSGCGQVPISMKSSSCDVCGNF
jgi:mobilome CxxCx(11)CxxC protein